MREDRGSAAIQQLLLFPLMLLVFGVAVQGGIIWHCRNIALASARQGAATAASADSTVAQGQTKAITFAAAAGDGALTYIHANHDGSTATQVRITVWGHVPGVLPGLSMITVRQSASANKEHFTS